MKKDIRKISKIFFIGLILSILVSPLRSGIVSLGSLSGFKLSSLVGFFIYFFSTAYLLKRNKKGLSNSCITISFTLGISLISLIIHILYFPKTEVSLLELFIYLFSIILGYVFYITKNKYFKISTLVFSFIFAFWLSTSGYDLWLHKLNFGTFLGRIENVKNNKLLTQNIQGKTLDLNDFKGKYLLLDCWYTRCGICYKAMPKVQKLYDKYKNNTDIQIYTLHSRMEDEGETYSTGSEILSNEGYIMPSLSIKINDPILKELGVQGYPTVLIFDKESKLIFRGNIESASKFLEEILNEELKDRS